jgi:hypothetical protein
MTVAELLKGTVAGCITEAKFMEEFSSLFRGSLPMSAAESQCLNELIEDVNMAEHGGRLFDEQFVSKAEECLRQLDAGASSSEIKGFFRANRL